MRVEGLRLEEKIIGHIESAGFSFRREFPIRPQEPVVIGGKEKRVCVLDGVIFVPHEDISSGNNGNGEGEMRQVLVEITASGNWNGRHKRGQRKVLEASGINPQKVLLLGDDDLRKLNELQDGMEKREYLLGKMKGLGV